MKIKLTKWERETLYNICKTIPGGSLGQIEQDMRIMGKLELSDKDKLKIFYDQYYDEQELATINELLGRINLNVSTLLKNLEVIDDSVANTQTELTFEDKDVKRLVQIALQGSGYPKVQRTLELKKRIDQLQEKLK